MPNELLEKGRLLDQLGRYDEAWAAFAEGKRLAARSAARQYLADQARQQAERLRGFFTDGRLRAAAAGATCATDVPQPIFILGFPRSGTTLVEQTLSAHPQHRRRRRTAADPRDHRDHAAHAGTARWAIPRRWPNCGWATSAKGSTICATIICRRSASWACCGPGATRFTDKMPLNETHLGLIALLFPRGAADPRAAPSARRHGVGVLQPVHPRVLLLPMTLETAARHYVLVMDLVRALPRPR